MSVCCVVNIILSLQKLFSADKCISDLNLFRCGNKISLSLSLSEYDLRKSYIYIYSFNLVRRSIYRIVYAKGEPRDVTLIYTCIRVLVHRDF